MESGLALAAIPALIRGLRTPPLCLTMASAVPECGHHQLAGDSGCTAMVVQSSTVLYSTGAHSLAAFAAHGLPLHLRLLASAARRWRSFDLPRLGEATLPTTTPELLAALLELLEAPGRNGQALVARSLGDLAAGRLGLAEDELLDVLSRD